MQHTIRILNRNGDTAVKWDTESAEETANAADEFLRLQQRGCTMFAVGTVDGVKVNRRLDEFEPNLAEDQVIAIYQISGG